MHTRTAINPAAVILGGHVNGYSIIRELSSAGVSPIHLVDYGKSLSRRSQLISSSIAISKNALALLEALKEIHKKHDYLVIYPTDDLQLEFLRKIFDSIRNFCFIPFNPENVLESLKKSTQYAACAELGVPYPRTVQLYRETDVDQLRSLMFPLLLKPNKRDDLSTDVFRNLYLEDEDAIEIYHDKLVSHLREGISILASEFIPGDDTRIYAYTGYRSPSGSILNEWIGKKLTQYPDSYGVFSSASNEAPEIVREQGRRLLEGMDIHGIAEPEFKQDPRDGSFKLMEINLRSMMWHRVGNLSGVRLHYTQWCDAIGHPVRSEPQKMLPRVHFVYMRHELINLRTRKGYWKHFRHNVFGGDRTGFGVFNKHDPAPFFYSLLLFMRSESRQWLKFFFSR